MQLTWNDVLKKNPWILNLTNIYFSVMTDMNTGKASTKFREKADELNNIVLENKSIKQPVLYVLCNDVILLLFVTYLLSIILLAQNINFTMTGMI